MKVGDLKAWLALQDDEAAIEYYAYDPVLEEGSWIDIESSELRAARYVKMDDEPDGMILG